MVIEGGSRARTKVLPFAKTVSDGLRKAVERIVGLSTFSGLSLGRVAAFELVVTLLGLARYAAAVKGGTQRGKARNVFVRCGNRGGMRLPSWRGFRHGGCSGVRMAAQVVGLVCSMS